MTLTPSPAKGYDNSTESSSPGFHAIKAPPPLATIWNPRIEVLLSRVLVAEWLSLAIAGYLSFAYADPIPLMAIPVPVSEVLQSQPSITRPPAARSERPLLLWQTIVIVALLMWLYGPTLARLVGQWWKDPNFSHGFFVPLFSVFVVWQERSRLSGLSPRPSWWGLLFLAMGMCVLIVGQMGAELFLSRVSLLIVMGGCIVLFLGWNFLRALAFPWAFLLLMIPIPTILFNQITFPLQLLASRVASTTLPWMGVPVLREGNVIVLPAMALEVAEACSGIRSLMSLATLAVIYGYLMEQKVAIRVVLALASIPIAVAANSLRIVGTGLLVQYWDPEKAQGFFHEFSGWLIFVISLSMLYLFHRLVGLPWHNKSSQS
jgi:exosortase